MTLNPREYDTDELRALAGIEPVAEGSSRLQRPKATPEESFRTEQFRQLIALQSDRADLNRRSRPFIAALPGTDLGRRVQYEWLEFLVLVGGRTRTKRAIRYYRTLQWITPAVEHQLITAADELSEPTFKRPFTAGDHRLSLLYVATLASLV